MILEFAVGLLTSLTLIILGLFTFFKNRKSATNVSFTFLTFVLAGWTFTNYFSLHSPTEVATLFWVRVVMLITSFMGPALFILLHSYPSDQLKLKKKYLYGLAVATVVSAVLSMSPFMFTSVSIADGVQPAPGPAILYFALVFFSSVIAGFVSIIKKYFKSKGLEKLQIKYLFLGLIITFVLFTLTNFVFVVALGLTSLVVLGPMFNLILVGFISYAIMKHRLMDIRLIVARTVSYTLLLAVLIVFYVLLLFGIGTIFYRQTVGIVQIFVNAILALIVAFTFEPLRDFLERLTDKIFFKERYDTEKILSQLTKLMSSTLVLKTLADQVLKKLVEKVKVEQAAIVLWEKGQSKQVFYQNSGGKLELDSKQLAKLIKAKHQPLVYDELDQDQLKALLREHQFYFSQPLKVKEEVVGLLLLGQKLSGDIYFKQDIELLEILVPQLSVAVQNALAYQEIQKFSETLKDEVDKATKALKKTNQKLRQVSALKDEFVSLTSHELRTPLTAIGSSLATIIEGYAGKMSKEAQEFLEGAYNENQRLLRLVGNLLNISRIESGRLKYQITNFNLSQILESVVDSLESQVNEKGLSLVYEVVGKPLVKADEDKVKEVLVNLIGNAVKYTDKGRVGVTVWQQGGVVLVSVEDTGPGIAQKDQQRLFQKFERVDQVKPKERKGGTGLGLYICKTLVEGMGGQVWLESVEQQGTAFYFSLPQASSRIKSKKTLPLKEKPVKEKPSGKKN